MVPLRPLRLLCPLLLLIFAWEPLRAAQTTPPPLPPGVTCEPIGTYDTTRMNQVLTTERSTFCSYPISYPKARYGVRLYRITYRSVIPEQGNRPTVASGLLAIPESGATNFPVLSYQHGTVFSKTAVPSRPEESDETRLNLARFSGQGYLVVAADYFGKGSSTEQDSYLVKDSTQQACLDMLRAARAASQNLGVGWGPLFLSGWSQGGWATLVFLERLEKEKIPVTASAPICAPTDLFALVNRWLHVPSEKDSVFIPELIVLQLNAYARYYDEPGLVEKALRPQYRKAADLLYHSKLAWPGLLKQFPRHLAEMLQPDFVAASSIGQGGYWELSRKNEAGRWRILTPIRSYCGVSDEIVPPSVALLPVNYQQIVGGAPARCVEVKGAQATHRGTFLRALLEEKKWFDSFLGK